MPANLVFRRKIWGARDNGIPPRSTPGYPCFILKFEGVTNIEQGHIVSNSDLESCKLTTRM